MKKVKKTFKDLTNLVKTKKKILVKMTKKVRMTKMKMKKKVKTKWKEN
jgi:hypothetical protein